MARAKPRFARDATVGSLYGAVAYRAGTTLSVPAGGTGARVAPPEYEMLLVSNLGTAVVYLKMGTSTVVASATDYDLALGGGKDAGWRFDNTADTHIAGFSTTATPISISGCM